MNPALFDNNNSKLIISLYDYTGNWAKPYADAGYAVHLWDLEHEGCILESFGSFLELINDSADAGYIPYGLLCAPPCTEFASSGARWWEEKSKPKFNVVGNPVWCDEITERSAARKGLFDTALEHAKALVEICDEAVQQMRHTARRHGRDLIFWSLENPVGRIETECPWLKPYRKLSFNPNEFGDPYTKQTILWGEFNANLPKASVAPAQGSKMHMIPGGKKQARLRSATPMGFARSFFLANQ